MLRVAEKIDVAMIPIGKTYTDCRAVLSAVYLRTVIHFATKPFAIDRENEEMGAVILLEKVDRIFHEQKLMSASVSTS